MVETLLAETLQLGPRELEAITSPPDNYVGGRDGAAVFSLSADLQLFPHQQQDAIIKIFRSEPHLAQKELRIANQLHHEGLSVVRMYGRVSFTNLPKDNLWYSDGENLQAVAMEEIHGVPRSGVPKNQRRVAFEKFISQIVGAMSIGLRPGDSYWDHNVLYVEGANGVEPVLFDFSRWQEKKVRFGEGLEFLAKKCRCAEETFWPDRLVQLARRGY